jgi:predicted phosphodiesterase
MQVKQVVDSLAVEQRNTLRKAFLKGSRYKFGTLKHLAGLSSDEQLLKVITELRKEGMKIIHSRLDRSYFLSTIPTPYSDYFDMSFLPKIGKLGLISDTHLCSDAERVDLIEQIYSDFEEHGITNVIHSGDIMDGWQVYKGHEQFVKIHGGQAQAAYCAKHYPSRKGMTTYFIGGNHDLRSYEKTGIDQCSLIVNGFIHGGKDYTSRKDMVYLGQYSRFLLFPNDVTVHVLHPRGSNPYAKSYAQQRRAREMKTDTRPNLQISGHMHQFNFLKEDISFMLAMPGVQDETEFFIRQGYRRDLGYIIMDYEVGKARFDRLRVEYIELD